MALGGRLVEQFNLKGDEDTLGQWIAHHLAEKLTAHKKASGPAKAALEIELIDTILKFWKHRAYFPRGARPFEGYDAVLRALESFDPNPDNGHYFQYNTANELTKGKKPPAQTWIDAAKSFDRGARAIVTFCFQQAARASEQPDEVWLSAAKVLAEDTDRDVFVVRFLSGEAKEEDEEIDPLSLESKELKKKRDDLQRLIRGGIPILKLISDRLEELDEKASGSDRSKRKSISKSKDNMTKKRGTKRPSQRAISKSSKKKAPSRRKRAATGS